MPTFFNFNNRKGVFMIPAGATKSPTPAPPSFSNTKSLLFDGLDEYIDLSQQNFGTTNTISLWLKNPSIKGAVQETLLGNPLNTFNQFLNVDWNTGKMFYKDSSNNRVEWNTLATINDTNWNNIIITRSGATVTLYFNGVSQGNGTAFGTLGDTEFRYLGINFNTNTQAFNGNIDEVAIFNTVLTTDQINTIATAPSDLTSLNPTVWYRCGDNSTYQTPQILMPENTNKDKVSNYSLSMDGVDDFVSIYDGTSGSGPIQFTASDDFSISAWVKTSSLSSTNYILSFRGTALIWFYTFSTSGNIRLKAQIRDNSSNSSSISSFNNSTGWIAADTWTNIIATRNGTTKELNIYLNGTQAQTTTTDTTTDDFTLYDKLSIGNDNFSGGRYWYTGQIDEVAIFDSVVDVASVYNSGTPTTISGALVHWKMGEQATFSTNWTVPDQVGSNDGTSANMTIEDRVGDASNSSLNAVSFNMESTDIDNNVPT